MAAPQAAGERGARLAAGRDAVERAGKPGQQAAQHGADRVVFRAFDAVERLARRFQLRPRDCRQRPRRAVADFAAVHAQASAAIWSSWADHALSAAAMASMSSTVAVTRSVTGAEDSENTLASTPSARRAVRRRGGVRLEGIARADDVPAAGHPRG